MGIDISHTHTVEVGYDEFCGSLAARDLKARGELHGEMVVATTMSNMGLEAALTRDGSPPLRMRGRRAAATPSWSRPIARALRRRRLREAVADRRRPPRAAGRC